MLKKLLLLSELKRYKTSIFEEIVDFQDRIAALRPFDSEQEARILQKFRLDWNYNSNAIEGNSLTYGETVALLMHGVTAKGKPLKDHLDIKGHNEAINFLLSILKDNRPLRESDIRELHQLLLVENYKMAAITAENTPTTKTIEVGKYKTSANHVKTKTGEIHYYASPEEVPILMHELVEWLNAASEDAAVNPILVAAIFHHRFVAIHPFSDGNGRMARLLMNLILMRKGFPPVVIKKTDRETYYGLLSQADSGEYLPFIEFIANETLYALNIQLRGAQGENISDDDDFEKELFLLEKTMQGNDDFFKLTYSKENVKLALQQSFLPLFNFVNEKMRSAAKLFLGYDSGYYDSYHTFLPDIKMKKLFSDDSFFEPSSVNEFVVLKFFLKNYKKIQNPFSLHISMFIIYENTFFEIFYLIENSGNKRSKQEIIRDGIPLFKLPYHKQLTETQIKTATKAITDNLLQRIKELSNP